MNKQIYNSGELSEKEMEADIGFFPGPKKPKALTCRKPPSPQRRVCLEHFASARGTLTATSSAARLGSGPVFYTTIGN